MSNLSNDELIRRIAELRPWHMGIQINDEVNTADVFTEEGSLASSSNDDVSLLKLRDAFLRQLDSIYKDDLSDKSFLDCACNSGGYCFWISERGIKSATGFDVRKHWIEQARFIKTHRLIAPTSNIEFFAGDLMNLPSRNLQPCDITMFKGIFYHLADPVSGLKIAADLTREVMFFNTSTVWGEKDGYLKLEMESEEMLMSGVDGLSWFPTGPGVAADILKWLGFAEIKLVYNIQMPNLPHLGRIHMIAAREKNRLKDIRGKLL